MPDPTPPTIDARTFWQRYGPWLVRLALVVASAVLARWGIPVPPELLVVEKEVPAPAVKPNSLDEFNPTQGWVRDPDQIEVNLDTAQTLHFKQTPAGKAVMGDDDVFLWRMVRKAAKLPDDKYANINQQSVGCCVGCGWKHCADVVQATAIANGAQFEWKPISAEAIYGGSRVEVGGGRISGDGSVGAWAAKWSRERGGLIPMEKLGSHDLTVFSPTRARQWGKTGVPDELEPAARLHPIKGCALVTSWTDAKRAIQQGYPVAVCSDQGFTMSRDVTGRARPQGSWAHCMALIAVRSAKPGIPEGGFLLNSWGDQAHTGPVWPPDAPVAGFWADASVLDRMLRQGDSFALSDVAGFVARKPKPDWFVSAPQAEPARRDLFAVRREAVLAW